MFRSLIRKFHKIHKRCYSYYPMEETCNKHQLKWATPFKFHTPPVEDFRKVFTKGCEFLNAPTFCVILDKVDHRGSKYFI